MTFISPLFLLMNFERADAIVQRALRSGRSVRSPHCADSVANLTLVGISSGFRRQCIRRGNANFAIGSHRKAEACASPDILPLDPPQSLFIMVVGHFERAHADQPNTNSYPMTMMLRAIRGTTSIAIE